MARMSGGAVNSRNSSGGGISLQQLLHLRKDDNAQQCRNMEMQFFVRGFNLRYSNVSHLSSVQQEKLLALLSETAAMGGETQLESN